MNGNEQIDNLVTDLPKSELLLIAGSMIYPNSTEMIASPIFQKIVEFFKTKLDYIIIDTPPMSQAADAEELVDLADASILVVRQHTASVSYTHLDVYKRQVVDHGFDHTWKCIF